MAQKRAKKQSASPAPPPVPPARRGSVAKGVPAGAKPDDAKLRPGGKAAPPVVSLQPASPQPGSPPFTVVGVGASAGGLEAFSQLLRDVPSDAGLAFVLVQHLAPKHESMLSEILAGATRMTVVEVEDGMLLRPNHVFVIPPGTNMAMVHGHLRLTPRRADQMPHNPIDFFLRSLAEYAQSRAVGVILSGTASDGSAGLREIKAAGGITIAQEPRSAKYDGMPRAAIATGAVDLILPPEGIAQELARIAKHPPLRAVPPRASIPEGQAASDQHLVQIFALLRSASGVDFNYYKQPTVRRRLHRRMVLHKIAAVDQYLRFLQQNPAEVTSLYQDILIHVTRFFREPETFETVKNRVFPELIKARTERHDEGPIRLWIPGCSTGEEAYSVAIILLEFLENEGVGTSVQLFATDVSESAVEHARAGAYGENITADVSPERLRRFFNRTDGVYRISKQVRDLCVFARQDLTRDPPFSRLDLIVCRNVLIYLGSAVQKRLMNVFHYALKPSGFLMLGGSETVGPNADLFTLADKRHKLYTKKAGSHRPPLEFPPASNGAGRHDAARRAPSETRSAPTIQSEATRVILTRYGPPAVVVDHHFQIIHFRGQTGPFLDPAPGEASLNLLKMARHGLLHDLRSALAEASKSGVPARREGLRTGHESENREVNLEVVPLTGPAEKHFLVVFEEVKRAEVQNVAASAKGKPEAVTGKKAKKGKPASAGEDARAAARELARLQQELGASREYLQSIIQDLEAANEELQSANEEILSSNEELQSTNEELDTAKEELQSTNEELNTLNEELQGRNEEMGRINSDLVNLLGSVQIAIVMVAGDLRIRRFTPMAEKVLNLIPSDIGRPISDIKPNIDCPDLEKLIAESIDTVTIVEREVRDQQGNWFSMRIRPYKNLENRIDGAVLALFDMEASRQRDTMLREGRAFAEAVIDAVREPLVVLDGTLHVKSANRAFYSIFKTTPAQTEGELFFKLGGGQWDLPALRTLLEEIVPKNQIFNDFAVETDFRGLGRQRMMLNARRIDRHDGTAEMILLAIEEQRTEH